MKIFRVIFIAVASFFAFACTTKTALESYQMAESGNTTVQAMFNAPKSKLEIATINALSERKWNVVKDGNGINASLNSGGISAKMVITFNDNVVIFDTKGSNIDGRPIVPLRWIDMLKKSIAANLRAMR